MLNSFQTMDIKILDFIDTHLRIPFLDRIIKIITCLGNAGVVWILLSIYLVHSENYRMEGYMVIISLIMTAIIGEGIIKHLIRRLRPFITINQRILLISRPMTYSFPSGHAASSFAAAGVFIRLNPSVSIYITGLALLIAFSRLYLNVHYPSDVITGVGLGLLCSILVCNVFST